MQKIIKTLYLILVLVIIKSCVEPIEIKNLESEDFLVVEATLSDELKKQTVKLSRTFALDAVDAIKESNATVTIKNNSNTYSFTETSEGVYTSNIQFKAEANTNYTLEIKTQNGSTYVSSPEKLTGSSTITEITAKKEANNVNEEGIRIYLKGKGLNSDSKYFRYEYIETYQIIPPFWSGTKLEIVSDTVPFIVREIPNLDNNRICYNSLNSTEIILKETATLLDGIVDSDIKFIPKDDFIISHRYSILVKQYVQSFQAYNYYKTLNKLSTNGDSFTQTQPGFLLGNITSTQNENNKAIGYFDVSSVATKRLFLNREDFFPDDDVDFINDCEFIAPELIVIPMLGIDFAHSPLIKRLKLNEWIFYQLNPEPNESLPGDFFLVPKVCGDCTESGTNIKPSFWID